MLRCPHGELSTQTVSVGEAGHRTGRKPRSHPLDIAADNYYSDPDDPPNLQFYSMWATTYEGFYIGMLWNFLREEQLFIWPQFVFSRDGIHYDRRYREPFIPLSAEPEYDSVAIYAQQSIVHNKQIFTFYNGMNYRERRLAEVGGSGPTGALGLAVTPLDGFVSLDSTGGTSDSYAEVVTRPFRFSGNQLQLNIEVPSGTAGDVKVEILHSDHFPIVVSHLTMQIH